MSKKIVCFLALCVVSTVFISLVPTGTAQTYGGSVETGEEEVAPNQINYKDYFDYGEAVYYYVTATEDGVPLQNKPIVIEIVGPEGVGEVHNSTIWTDDQGKANGFWTGIYSSDLYTIYANYTGNNIATNTFRVYEPYPDEAEVRTYTDSSRTGEGYYFSSDNYVYYRIIVKDQWNNPYYESDDPEDIIYWAYHNGIVVDVNSGRNTNKEGHIDDRYRPSSSFPWYNSDEVYGLYQINVTRQSDWVHIGNSTFEVVDVELGITPHKPQYAQGDEITITIQTSIEDTIDVRIYDPDYEVLSNANWTDQDLINGQWTKDYNLGPSLADGDYEIQVIKDGVVMESETITVKKYNLRIQTDSEAYIPGETITTFYTVTHNKDGGGVSGTTIEYIFKFYDTKDGKWDTLSNEFTGEAFGDFLIPIPISADLDEDGELHVWANDTSGHSSYSYQDIELGWIKAYLRIGDPNPWIVDEYVPGDFIVVTVTADIEGISPLRNGNVYLNVSKDGIVISAYTKNNLKTDMHGELIYVFALIDNAEVGLYTMAINVSKENEWDTTDENFEVVENREMVLELGFDNKYYTEDDEPQYYSGDTVGVTYTALRGLEIVENVNCEYWVQDLFDDLFISAGTSSSGEFSFDIPENYDGILEVYVQVRDSEGNPALQIAYLDVDRAGLILTPYPNEYLPGDTIKVDYGVVGITIPDANQYYEVEDDDGNIVERGSLAQPNGMFQFTVPRGDVPDYYDITGYITDSNGVSKASSSVRVSKLTSFMVTFTLDRKTYKPGETATLKYKIISLDGSDVPEKFTLYYWYSGYLGKELTTSDPEGELTIEIPDDAPDGTGYFHVYSPELTPLEAIQEANIRENPNPFAETMGDISLLVWILLILVIISLIIGFIGMRRGKKALEEAKLPPWKKEGPLPEPEKFKGEEPAPLEGEASPSDEQRPPMEGGTQPSEDEYIPPPPDDTVGEPPSSMPPR
ncbi:MAG: hypothetical protein JSV09_05320 [Thermoplasmata archaeon]|nr:MAG: hypothetical protein JSV09_05320 [Thermoplasmata archaeon]